LDMEEAERLQPFVGNFKGLLSTIYINIVHTSYTSERPKRFYLERWKVKHLQLT